MIKEIPVRDVMKDGVIDSLVKIYSFSTNKF